MKQLFRTTTYLTTDLRDELRASPLGISGEIRHRLGEYKLLRENKYNTLAYPGVEAAKQRKAIDNFLAGRQQPVQTGDVDAAPTSPAWLDTEGYTPHMIPAVPTYGLTWFEKLVLIAVLSAFAVGVAWMWFTI